MIAPGSTHRVHAPGRTYYGWYIVAVGFIANVTSSFALASTLSIFLKPMTLDLGVSRGVFSLLRSGEGLIGAFMAPFVGPLVDRHGSRWLVTAGAVVAAVGYFILSQVEVFWQFVLVRWTFVTVGDALLGYMVINVMIARWFVRKRGRAIAVSSMGIGFAKIVMPFLVVPLLVWLGWRQTWAVFGVLTLVLIVVPALLYIRRSPEDMGLNPDGLDPVAVTDGETPRPQAYAASEARIWSRKAGLRTRAFWLIVAVFGVSAVGVTGVNLHVFAYVTDLGYSDLRAVGALSVIASTQLGSPLVWGIVADRVDVRWSTLAKFLIQAAGLTVAITSSSLTLVYVGFFFYGVGLGGNMVLQDVVWARIFGRLSMGRIRGLGILMTHSFAALGPPFFGFLFDWTGSYTVPFTLFAVTLVISGFLSLFIVAPPRASTA